MNASYWDSQHCLHCGTIGASALAPSGLWCEPCFYLFSELQWMCREVRMPEWPMRYGYDMRVYPWWDHA